MTIQRNRPEAVMATNAPVPSAEDVVKAFADLIEFGLLAGMLRFCARPDAASIDWQTLIQRHAGAVGRHSLWGWYVQGV